MTWCVVQQQFPDHVRLRVSSADSGEALARLAYSSDGYVFNSDEAISPKAKEIAASMFDHLQDIGDISDDLSFSEKLALHRELDGMLTELEKVDASCYLGSRTANIVGANWTSQTAIPFKIGYLTVVPKEKSLTEIMVPRQFS